MVMLSAARRRRLPRQRWRRIAEVTIVWQGHAAAT
jgi:hypothetical protein